MKGLSKVLFSAIKGDALKLDKEGVYILSLALNIRKSECLSELAKTSNVKEIQKLIKEYNLIEDLDCSIIVDSYVNALSQKEIVYLIAVLGLLSKDLKDKFTDATAANFDKLCKDVALCNMMKECLNRLKDKKEETNIEETK